MLIWIKAPYVAIGVLASFVLLLSTVVSEHVDLNATSDDSRFIASVPEEAETVQLMQLPFASGVINPCSWVHTNTRPPPFSNMELRKKFLKEFYHFVQHFSKDNKESVQEIIRNHTISGCEQLHIGNLPHTPTLEELQEMGFDKALSKIYASILIHSAYSFFIHHQVVNSDIRCSEDIQEEMTLAEQSHSMALKQKSFACYVLVGITILGTEREDVTPVLNQNISKLTLCSRRVLRDCQVLNSTYKFFDILFKYVTELMSGTRAPSTSTTAIPTSTTTMSTSTTSTTPTNSATSTTSTPSITRTTD